MAAYWSVCFLQQYHITTVAKATDTSIILVWSGLVPRPHPLTRRNGLANQVEFLGLAYTFTTMSPNNDQDILCQTHSKKGYLSSAKKILLLERKCRFCNLIGPCHFWATTPRNSPSFTRPFLAGRRIGWAQETRFNHTNWCSAFRHMAQCPYLDDLTYTRLPMIAWDDRHTPLVDMLWISLKLKIACFFFWLNFTTSLDYARRTMCHDWVFKSCKGFQFSPALREWELRPQAMLLM